MRLLPCGDLAILVELDDAAHRRRYDTALRRAPLPGVVEHVPAARTVLVRVETPAALPAVAARLRDLVVPDDDESLADQEEPLTLEVRYDGPDLLDVARHLGIEPVEAVNRHTGQLWTVEFSGFAPGFGYLVGDLGGLEMPRRDSPRTRIPPGSVGLAGPYTGVYPRPSPGGWQLIGSTAEVMWDPDRDPPALLVPGRRVRFAAVST
jgi:KipI family sensor histidine kinase inhibitor